MEDCNPLAMETTAEKAESILLTVKTNSKELIGLNILFRQVCDNQDLTWAEFFLQTANVIVDPIRYKVCSANHGEVLMYDKVRDLISKFKRKMPVYRVDVKGKKSGRLSGSGRIGNGRAAKTRTPLVIPGLRCSQGTFKVIAPQMKRNPKPISTNQWRQKILRMKRELQDMPRLRIADSTNSEMVTVPMTSSDDSISHQHQPTSSTRSSPIGFQPSPPRVADVGNEEFQFLAPRVPGQDVFQRPDIDADVDFDDTASQFTTMSQASQYNLDERGIVNRNVKTSVLKKFESNISNDMILVMMDELKKLDSKRWIRFSKHAPTTANCMTALFLLG